MIVNNTDYGDEAKNLPWNEFLALHIGLSKFSLLTEKEKIAAVKSEFLLIGGKLKPKKVEG